MVQHKEQKQEPQEVGGWGNIPECTTDLGDERLSGLKGGTLDKMPESKEKELIEPTSSRKTGHQGREGIAILQSKL